MAHMTEYEIDSKLQELLADGKWHDAKTVNDTIREIARRGERPVFSFEITEAVHRIGGQSRTYVEPSRIEDGYLLRGWQKEAKAEYRWLKS